MKHKTIAIIVAAGKGVRMGGGLPKQYRQLAGKSVLRRSVEAFLNHPLVDTVCVVIHPEHEVFYKEAVTGLSLLSPVMGGIERQDSVRHGVEHLFNTEQPSSFLVHDAARCLIDAETITRVVEGLKLRKTVLPVLPVSDTLKRVEEDAVVETVDRAGIYAAQTPQGFEASMLHELHQSYRDAQVTDDVTLAEIVGEKVLCVAGSAHNIKLTTEEDWMRAEMMLNNAWEYRTGSGYDVHELIPASEGVITLCGISINHTHKLKGHSDADVGLHALVDAMLGALALGDIGQHFPPSDERWKGADSGMFVRHAASLLAEKHAVLVNVDITLICEAPKIGPHREAMQKQVAELLGINASRVSIKATTTEGLGFAGRREGVAAQASVMVKLPN